MAISVSNLETTGSGTDATSYTTSGSISPAANSLTLIWLFSIVASGNPNIPTITGYTQNTTVLDGSGARRLTLYRAMNPSAGVLTFDFTGQTQTGVAWSIAQYTGVDVSGTNGSGAIAQAKSGITAAGSMSLSITLDNAIGSGNTSTGGFYHTVNQNKTVGTGYTAIGQRTQTTPNLNLASEYRLDGQQLVDMSWASGAVSMAIAAEVKADASVAIGSTLLMMGV